MEVGQHTFRTLAGETATAPPKPIASEPPAIGTQSRDPAARLAEPALGAVVAPAFLRSFRVVFSKPVSLAATRRLDQFDSRPKHLFLHRPGESGQAAEGVHLSSCGPNALCGTLDEPLGEKLRDRGPHGLNDALDAHRGAGGRVHRRADEQEGVGQWVRSQFSSG